jgi:hypothetical protein
MTMNHGMRFRTLDRITMETGSPWNKITMETVKTTHRHTFINITQHSHGALMMEAVRTSETSVYLYETKRGYIYTVLGSCSLLVR